MEVSSLGLSSLPSIHSHLKSTSVHSKFLVNPNFLNFKTHSSILRTPRLRTTKPNLPTSSETNKATSFPTIAPPPCLKDHFLFLKKSILTQNLACLVALCVPFPSFAIETTLLTEQASTKIDIEAVLVSIDDFFNRNPFFVSGITFIWLVVIPLTQEYLKKYKFISASDAFQKLQNDPNSQLLDIRDSKSLIYLGSPNLKILDKRTVQVQFLEGEEDGFVKEVVKNFKDPENTTICILDNFDGNSMKVAELLFKNGIKEAYAIKGGIRGKKGWQDIQETLLPPSVHVFSKKSKKSKEQMKEGIDLPTQNNGQIPAGPANNIETANGYLNTKGSSSPTPLISSEYLSPYPNYPDLKPPSSPTPSKPRD